MTGAKRGEATRRQNGVRSGIQMADADAHPSIAFARQKDVVLTDIENVSVSSKDAENERQLSDKKRRQAKTKRADRYTRCLTFAFAQDADGNDTVRVNCLSTIWRESYGFHLYIFYLFLKLAVTSLSLLRQQSSNMSIYIYKRLHSLRMPTPATTSNSLFADNPTRRRRFSIVYFLRLPMTYRNVSLAASCDSGVIVRCTIFLLRPIQIVNLTTSDCQQTANIGNVSEK